VVDRQARQVDDRHSEHSDRARAGASGSCRSKKEWLQTLDENVRKPLLSVLAWFAEFERKRIRERQLEAWSRGKQKGRPRKLRPEVVERYLKKYNTPPLSSILKIMRADGINVSDSTLRNYVKELGYHRVFGNWVKALRSTV